MRIFLDTNVWLSAIVFPGICAELLTAILESEHTLLTSQLVHTETCDVPRRKFAKHDQAIILFGQVWAEAICVADTDPENDDADARLVEAAADASATLFITGDQRVLSWSPHRQLQIVSPRDAWKLLFMPPR